MKEVFPNLTCCCRRLEPALTDSRMALQTDSAAKLPAWLPLCLVFDTLEACLPRQARCLSSELR